MFKKAIIIFALLPLAFSSIPSAAIADEPVGATPKSITLHGHAYYVYSDNPLRFNTASHNIAAIGGGQAVINAATSDVVIIVGKAALILEKGGTAFVSECAGVAKVRNLCDFKTGSINVILNERKFEIGPGQELLWAPTFAEVANAASADGMERRLPMTFEDENGTGIMLSEYSRDCFFRTEACLKRLYDSNEENTQKVMSDVLKMAASLQFVTASHGQFALVE